MSHLDGMTTGFSSAQVITRFALRMVILCVFASFGSVGFARSFAALLWMSTIICMLTALLRREPPLGAALTYWDEAAAYGALFCLAGLISVQAS